MTSSLYWKPVDDYSEYFPDELKYVLRTRFDCGHIDATQMNESDIPYLEGLRDGGIKGAAELIKAIKEHGTVVIEERY